MRSWCYLIAALLLPGLACAEGEMVVQPQVNGDVHFFAEGFSAGGDSDTISALYNADRPMSLLLSPAGKGRCEGELLAVETLKLSAQIVGEKSLLGCGVPVVIEDPSKEGRIRIQLKKAASVSDFSALMREKGALRQQMGVVQISQQGSESHIVPIYLDLTLLQQQVITLSAAFDKPALQFGLIGPDRDATATANLRIGKTLQAGNDALLYRVAFESSQLQDNRYRLLSSTDQQFIPYQIFVSGVEVTPSQPYEGELPEGIATSELLNVKFSLSGKAVHGMTAGSRLLDTVTAVVTPES
ncbi:hypothetical protein MAQ58_13960 [Enterobacter sp. DRP3]|nr:hypothetical protein [Enterobacter sp. DRP3]